MKNSYPSIFNDVIGPVMRGPSSSHCAAALRIGRLARDLMNGDFREVLVEFDRNGSLATTHESQGSDMGLFGGLLGWDAVDERLPGSRQALLSAGIKLRIKIVNKRDKHPNTYRLTLRSAGAVHSLIAVSTGGGMIEVVNIDGFSVSMSGDCHETLFWVKGDGRKLLQKIRKLKDVDEVILHKSAAGQLVEVKAASPIGKDALAGLQRVATINNTAYLPPLLPVLSRRKTSVPFTTCSEMMGYNVGRNMPLWKLAVEYEMARGGMSEEEVIIRMVEIVRILRGSIKKGIAGTRYADRISGYQCGAFKQLMESGQLLDGGMLNRMILYVSALMEVKSAMGVIVAAPTAGACAALPGAVIAAGEERGLSEEDMAKALLAAGVVGVFIAKNWTFAAEEGGCQAECGSAAGMAAAAMVSLAGGTTIQATAAASMAIQNILGLICDPVANRVEVPCLGRNVMAASNALSCANMALAGYDPVIPLDEVIETAKRVGRQLPRELRCTALGGLSITPSSRAIAQGLKAGKSPACNRRGAGCMS